MSTLTTKLSLISNIGADDFTHTDFASNWAAIDAAPGIFICTHSTRPTWTTGQSGRFIYETDTSTLFEWTGTTFNPLTFADTGWTSVSAFTNSWANQSGYVAAYRKVGTSVHLRGAIAGGVSASAAFTLPAGYVPPVNLNFATASNSTASGVPYIFITTGGIVTVENISSSSWVSLDGISFTTN